MKVTAVFKGVLTGWVGSAEAEFELAEGAVYQDLLHQIEKKFGKKMRPKLWDKKNHRFDASVAALIEEKGQKIDDPDTPLHHGQKIFFFLMALGG
jgi:hypothetical protein